MNVHCRLARCQVGGALLGPDLGPSSQVHDLQNLTGNPARLQQYDIEGNITPGSHGTSEVPTAPGLHNKYIWPRGTFITPFLSAAGTGRSSRLGGTFPAGWGT